MQGMVRRFIRATTESVQVCVTGEVQLLVLVLGWPAGFFSSRLVEEFIGNR